MNTPADTRTEATGKGSSAAQMPTGESHQSPSTTDYHSAIAAGTVIAGRYRLVTRIGEGGMGEVWAATQSEPVKRKVAIKLIKPGMDSRAVLARFEQERQALAMMDHPNIAKVLDGGMTPAGQPFFVMELVNGMPLTGFCDQAKLKPRERLELFVPICQAVQHAHQKGIVHRDLKPSNILVTLYDGKAVPKVIDFGVAKATGGKLTDHSLSTQFGSLVGTLEYMSPEQAGFSGFDVDTRADIYSLGVILYELLSGLRPIDAKRLKNAAITEMVRVILEEVPSKPSTRLSSDAALASLAALRQTEPRRLMALLRGELDCVVMKCLEKQRERRYESASALARDIQRYLADEPVEARPPSTSYRFRKFLWRSKGPVTAAAVMLLALLGGTAGIAIGLVRAQQAQRAEAAQRARAEKARDRTREALDAMTSSVTGDSLATQVQISPDQKKFLTEVLTYYQEFAGEKSDDELSRSRTAAAAFRVGVIQARLGRTEESIRAYELSRDEHVALAADFPGEASYRLAVARSRNSVALLLVELGRPADAEKEHREAIAIVEKLVAEFPADLELREELALSHRGLGVMLLSVGNLVEAEKHQRKSLEIEQKLVAGNPGNRDYRRELAETCKLLGLVQSDLGKADDALEQYREAIQLAEKLAVEFPDVPGCREISAGSQDNLGILLDRLGKLPEAEEQLRHALLNHEKLVTSFPAAPGYRHALARTHTNLGNVLEDQGKFAPAVDQHRRAAAILENLVAEHPSVPIYRVTVGGAYCNLANALGENAQIADSLPWYQKAIDTLGPVVANEKRNAVAQLFLRNCYRGRALARDSLGQTAPATDDWAKAVELSSPQERPGMIALRALSRPERASSPKPWQMSTSCQSPKPAPPLIGTTSPASAPWQAANRPIEKRSTPHGPSRS